MVPFILNTQYLITAIAFYEQMIFIMKWQASLGEKLQRLEISIFDQYPDFNNFFNQLIYR